MGEPVLASNVVVGVVLLEGLEPWRMVLESAFFVTQIFSPYYNAKAERLLFS